jgi:HEAT repeat protein
VTGSFDLPDIEYIGPNTDVPAPPAGLSYPDYDDWYNRELLVANGIEPDEPGISAALRSQDGVLLAAAAQCAHAFPSLAPLLRQLLAGVDDDAAVEAAYSLARQGDDTGRKALHTAMDRAIGPYLSPVRAAGRLARLGDLSGEPVIQEGLTNEFIATRMLSCKQVYFFAASAGWAGLVAAALADEDLTVQREILLQLGSQRSPAIVPVLREYLRRTEDPMLVRRATEILESPDALQ